MSSLEAAASLFGSDNASADPFASLGSNEPEQNVSTSDTTPHHSTSEDLFGGTQGSDFLADTYENRAFVEESGTQSQANSSYYDNWSTAAQVDGNSNGAGYDAQTWYGDSGQTQNDYSQSSNGTATASNLYDPYAPAAANSSTPAHSYDPYVPPVQQPAVQEQSLYAPSQSAAQSDAYAPNTYSQSTSTMPSSYAPYATPATNYGTPSYSGTSPYAASASTVTSVPPPPAPKAPLNRPKVSNAYDPPFPVSNASTRRATPRTTPNLASAFGAYASPPPPQQPPPPPSASPYGSPYAPQTQPMNQPTSNFYEPPAQASGYRPPSVNGQAHGQSTYGGSSDYSPQPQSSVYSPPPRTNSVQSMSSPTTYTNTNGYSPPTTQSHAAPPPPKQTFTPPPPARTPITTSTPPPPPAQSNMNHYYGSNRTASPRIQSPLSRNESPAIPAGPPRKTSVLASTSTPPPPPFHGNNRVASPASVKSLQTQSPEVPQSSPSFTGIRTASPATVTNTVDPYAPPAFNAEVAHVSPEEGLHSSQEDPEGNSYAPPSEAIGVPPIQTTTLDAFSAAENTSTSSASPENPYLPQRQTSVPAFGAPPATNGFGTYAPNGPPPPSAESPYVPKVTVGPPPPHVRSMSNGSVYSQTSDTYDPYAPSRHPRKQQSETDYGSFTSRYDYPNNDNSFPPPATDNLGPPQELLVKAPTHAPYAPSPSLLGTNDPLGRAGARVPVFSFGFGGKIVTCFHGADKLSTGFDVALASRNSTGIQIRVLNKVVPESALDLSPSSFPGPLFSDPGSPTAGLVRPGASAQTKTKKTRLVKYLTDRADEISQGLGYLHAGSPEKRQAEGKLVLVKLLKIMIEHDGKLLGSPQAEAAVRNALVPELELSTNGTDTDTFTTGFAAVGEDGILKSQLPINDTSDAPIAVASLRPSSLDKIQDFLLRGEKRKAYHYALDQKLWAHAMVIASGIDREAWKEVVNEFLRTELGSKDLATRAGAYPQTANGSATSANGREALRVAYSLFSGQGSASVQELIPQNSMLGPQAAPARLPLPAVSHTTPMTPNFTAPMPVANIPAESLSKWAEMVSMMISSSMSPETSSALTALGDQLCGNNWVEAGHVCYLLSSQTSPIGGVGNPSARLVLLGAPNPQTSTRFLRDTDAIIFSEILEFAMGLAPSTKGHEPFQGLAHLQAYRLVRAMLLAEIGEISLANRYCEAITASMNRGSPYFTHVLSDQLRGLSNRIAGTSHSDKSSSWVSSKIGKPSLDSIGGWLEGRFTKLVTGDEDNADESKERKSEEQGFVGPFSSYSAMSSATPSNDPSPQSSVVNLNSYAPSHSTYVPNRTGSSMSNRSLRSNGIPPPQERAASAMDYAPRRKASPGPKIASASASTTTFAQSRSYGQSMYSPPGTAKQDQITPRSSTDISEEDEGQEVSWWGGDNGRTPTTANFMQFSADHAPVASSEGFISLMDNSNFAVQPQSSSSLRDVHNSSVEEEEEDLGFGNSKKPQPKSPDREGDDDSKESAAKEKAPAPAPPQRPDPKPAQAGANANSGSWLSRWWKRDSTPGPVRANLGEEKTFYYDPELKRWVNKAAGEPEAPKAAAPPPPPSRTPSRAQTASPGMSGPRPPSTGPPPPRSASAANLSAPPPSKLNPAMRISSHLVPTPEIPEGPGSAPSTPTGTRLAPPGPPPGRPRSQASKRNIRSRYVDVLQQDGA